MSEKTLGEKRVNLKKLSNNITQVELTENAIKTKAAEAIDLLEEFKKSLPSDTSGETFRLIALAQTSFEEASMWGTKSAYSIY